MIRSLRKTLRVRRAHSSKTATSGAASAVVIHAASMCGPAPEGAVGSVEVLFTVVNWAAEHKVCLGWRDRLHGDPIDVSA
jgi:hypothetical protein